VIFLEQEVLYAPLKRSQMPDVISLLQGISQFAPDPDNYDEIWINHSLQENVTSIVAHHANGLVLGFATLVLEAKIRGGKIGHIEDIVTHHEHRGMGVGRSLVHNLVEIARLEGCYKVALHCKDHNILFYEKSGFEVSGSAMQRLL
jgi:glucosamine-phosphate N-acetyltransferase